MKKASTPEVTPTVPGTPFAGGLFCWRFFDEKGAYALVVSTRDGDFAGVTHDAAEKKAKVYRAGKHKDWTLPNRAEALAMFEHLRPNLAGKPEAFERDWYWTSQPHERVDGYAWYQTFNGGTQGHLGKGARLRARAVRRIRI